MTGFQKWIGVGAGVAVFILSGAARAEPTEVEMAAVRAVEAQRVETIDRVRRTVVSIYGEQVRTGGGSGVLFDPAGLALTNYHVVAAIGEQGWAGLSDGNLYRWRLVGVDPGGDLAVIQLDREQADVDAFPHAPLGNSDTVDVGDFVMAMGNPFALADDHSPTVTLGIVSGVNRYQGGQDADNTLLVYGNCIQVDSSINPGNSGGPLFNMAGEIVGINGRGSFAERGRVNVGLGYAITTEQVRNFLPELLATKIAEHGTLDATFRTRARGTVICDGLDLGRSPLVEHGFQLGDELIAFNGQSIDTANQFLNELTMLPAGWPVEVVWRGDGGRRRAEVELNALRYPDPDDAAPPRRKPSDDEGDGDGGPPDNLPDVQVEPPAEQGEVQNADLNAELARLLLRRAGAVTGASATAASAESSAPSAPAEPSAEDAPEDATNGNPPRADRPPWQRRSLNAYDQIRIEGAVRLSPGIGMAITMTEPSGHTDRLRLDPFDAAGRWMTRPRVVQWTHGSQPDNKAEASTAPTVQSHRPMENPTERNGNFFRNAVAHARQRLVKIYGAGIGREHGYATGVLVSGAGHIVTAQGIWLAGDRLRVVLPDGSVHRAAVQRRAEPIQLALLKVDARTPDYFPLRPEPTAARGDWVLAVSNAYNVADRFEPLGANLGIVSMRGELDTKKRAQDFDVFGDVLMLDAIVANPGAPGGAVVTRGGELAGVIGKILEAQATNTRLNYAVPNDLVARFVEGDSMESLIAGQGDDVTDGPGTLGIRIFKLSGRRAPAYIDRVRPGYPADEAGLKTDDLVLSFDGQWVRNVRDYEELTEGLQAGRTVEMTLKRGGEVLRVTLTAVAEEDRR